MDYAGVVVLEILYMIAFLALTSAGLAIVFGMMRVINLAHGEFVMLGGYTTIACAKAGIDIYFAMLVVAPLVVGVWGLIVERLIIRFLYGRMIDTMLATWGLSLVLQQTYRSLFGAQEVSVPMTSWLDGAWEPVTGIQFPLNRLFIIALTVVVSVVLYLALFRTRWGLRIRAVTQNRAMSAAAGINTDRVDATTFAVGSGLAGIAGAVFTMIGSTNPLTGQLYIVDSFIVVVFGGVQSLLGTFLSGFVIAQTQTTLEYVLTGAMAKVSILLFVIVVLYFRPNGLFSSKVRQ